MQCTSSFEINKCSARFLPQSLIKYFIRLFTMKEGDFVICNTTNGSHLIQLDSKKPIRLNKQNVKSDGVLGSPFGTAFRIEAKNLVHINNAQYMDHLFPDFSELTEESGSDNRNLKDESTNQKLSRDDIESFKKDGASGDQIVEKIVANSASFRSKTEYSQEKYLRKKRDKYQQVVVFEKPTVRLLVEMYYSQGPCKIGCLRSDSLAAMLCACNIIPGATYVTFDSYMGVVSAALLERGAAKVVQIFEGDGPSSSFRQAVDALMLLDLEDRLFGIPYSRVVDGLKDRSKTTQSIDDHSSTLAKVDAEGESKPVDSEQQSVTSCDSEKNFKIETDDEVMSEIGSNRKRRGSDVDEGPEAKVAKPENRENLDADRIKNEREMLRDSKRQKRKMEQENALELLKSNHVDGLLIVSRSHPFVPLTTLIECLAPSRPFAVFSQYTEPLVECYEHLKASKCAVFMKITETWLRKQQVLPNRTHPEIQMSSSSGFLLTGIRVLSCNN